MKRITLIFTIAFAFLIGCELEGRPPRGCFIAELGWRDILESRDILYLSVPGISVGIEKWEHRKIDTYDIQVIQNYMYNQICEHLDKPNVQKGFGYFYETLTDVNIIADCEIGGRDSGENLADLFEFRFFVPLFRFPSGEMLEYGDWQNPITKTFAEFLDGKFFYPQGEILFTCDELSVGDYENIHITITLTLSDGTNEKILTSSCTL